MIDEEIIKIANARIRIEIGEQNSNLSRQIDRIKSEMAARGMFRSGVTITRVSDLCIETVKNRAQLIWQTLFRFITTTGISYAEELSEELKSIVANNLPMEKCYKKCSRYFVVSIYGCRWACTTWASDKWCWLDCGKCLS